MLETLVSCGSRREAAPGTDDLDLRRQLGKGLLRAVVDDDHAHGLVLVEDALHAVRQVRAIAIPDGNDGGHPRGPDARNDPSSGAVRLPRQPLGDMPERLRRATE